MRPKQDCRTQASAVGRAGPRNLRFEKRVCDSEGEAWFQTVIKYQVILYWSEEDLAFIAEAPVLPDAPHGDTKESALGSAQDANRLGIDTAKEFGDPIPEPKRRA
jgi:predicted RNase H-like HicB family nuclease